MSGDEQRVDAGQRECERGEGPERPGHRDGTPSSSPAVAGLVAGPAQDFDVAAALVGEPAVVAVVDGQPPAAAALLTATASVQDPQPTS
jgi:hypothetical protein